MNSVLSQSDRFNPVFLKEVRQTLHGPAVPLVLLVELLALLAWLAWKQAWPVDLNDVLTHQTVVGYRPALVLLVALRLMLPILLGGYAAWVILMTQIRRFTAERDAQQADVVFLTMLTPLRFLFGQWLAGMSLALLPLALAMPFWLVILWELPTSVDGVIAAGVMLSGLGGMLAVVMLGAARGAGGSSLWRQIASIGCWFFGILMLPGVMAGWFYWLESQQESAKAAAQFLRGLVWASGVGWLGLLAVGVFAWALLVVSSTPNTRRAECARRWLRWALAASLLTPAAIAIWFAVKDQDILWLTALPTLLALWKAGAWKIHRLGHPAQDGLVLTVFLSVRHFLAVRRRHRPAATGEGAGDVWMKLRFFDHWPIFRDANPVFIKELRQAIRNLLLPAIVVMAFLSGFLGLLKEARTEIIFYRHLFFPMVLNWLLVGWTMGVVLMQADRCRQEAAGEENDLLFSTPLSPGWLIRGKWGMMIVSVVLVALGMLPHLLIPVFLSGNWRGLPDTVLVIVMTTTLASLFSLLLAMLPLPKMLFQGLGGLLLLGMFVFCTVSFLHSLDLASQLGLLLTVALLAACLHAMAVVLAGWPRQAWRPVAATLIGLSLLFLAHLPFMVGSFSSRTKVWVVAPVAIIELVAWIAWRRFAARRQPPGESEIEPGYFQNPRTLNPAESKK